MFPETKWTMLAEATLNGDAKGRAALEDLCQRYWPAVRDFLGGKGFSSEDAEDITQDFFSSFLRSGTWHVADRGRGRFRSFLLGCVERSVSTWLRKNRAAKRGGGQVPVSLDSLVEGEASGLFSSPAEPHAASLPFDTAWAEHTLEMAIDRLEEEFAKDGRGDEFARLAPFLMKSAGEHSNRELASTLQTTEAAVKSRIHRLRQRFRDAVLAEVAQTVETPHEAEEEFRYLVHILSAPGTREIDLAG